MRDYSYLDKVADGYWVWDLKNPDYEYMSPKFWETLGYDPKDMPHSPTVWKGIIHSEDLKRAEAAFLPHVEHGEPYHLLVRYRHKLGTWVWIVCRGSVEYDDDGEPHTMLGVHQDVTNIVKKHSNTQSKISEASYFMLKTVERILWELDRV